MASAAPPITNETVEIVPACDASSLFFCASLSAPHRPGVHALFASDHFDEACKPKNAPSPRPTMPTPPTVYAAMRTDWPLVPLTVASHNLVLNEEHVKAGRQHDLDDKGIAKTAREEKTRARDEALKTKLENDKMARLYREHVLGVQHVTV